ncbi:hypothetical protein [Jeotgalibacillus sp. R-1-5s-1]|uniref:hypothetical protein n=1 Tax=Jeotgalibacillus sp. R-1-5s-1 TaxID=2555897 RepID=UPI00106D5185|nr:hypothetical protein [Jeotgalibacillus sp. R-1-5s-1]TFD97046.1 hypothetical protein E2491_10145 [Jeotgalibacillus sp. R-1-5s-1]
MKSKLAVAILSGAILFSGFAPSIGMAESSQHFNIKSQKNIIELADMKIQERINIGDQDFLNLEVKSVKKLKDIENKYTKSMIVLKNKGLENVAGYMILDHSLMLEDALVEF